MGEVSVVLLQVFAAWAGQLQCDKLETLVLKSLDDLADESTLDAIRLDHDVGALGVGRHFEEMRGEEGKREEERGDEEACRGARKKRKEKKNKQETTKQKQQAPKSQVNQHATSFAFGWYRYYRWQLVFGQLPMRVLARAGQ